MYSKNWVATGNIACNLFPSGHLKYCSSKKKKLILDHLRSDKCLTVDLHDHSLMTCKCSINSLGLVCQTQGPQAKYGTPSLFMWPATVLKRHVSTHLPHFKLVGMQIFCVYL